MRYQVPADFLAFEDGFAGEPGHDSREHRSRGGADGGVRIPIPSVLIHEAPRSVREVYGGPRSARRAVHRQTGRHVVGVSLGQEPDGRNSRAPRALFMQMTH